MTTPKVGSIDRREGGVVYFRAEQGLMGGRTFRVHDLDVSGEKALRVEHGSPAATNRVFLQADRGRWVYTFSAGERRELTVPALERQLQAAKYLAADARSVDGR